MSNEVVVHKGRFNTLPVFLYMDVEGETFTSEIRTQPTQESELIAPWEVEFLTDGSDGVLILTMDELVTAGILQASGYMDLKRITGGEPVSVFEMPLEVLFRGTVTA